jgi:hypothetical protein
MKTKIWIMVGVMIIAFATMAVPVMAAADQTVSVSGTDSETVTFTVTNPSLGFGSFNLGTNNTVDSTKGTYSVVQLKTNSNSWSIVASNTSAVSGHMMSGSLSLANATGIQAESPVSGHGITGTSGLISLSATSQAILTGTQTIPTVTDISPLKIDQYVSTGDIAATTPYSIVITLGYQSTLT